MHESALQVNVGEGPHACWLLLEVDPVKGTSRVMGLFSSPTVTGPPRLVLPVAVARAETFSEAEARLVRALAKHPLLRPVVVEHLSRGSTSMVHTILDPSSKVPGACPLPSGRSTRSQTHRFELFEAHPSLNIGCIHCGASRAEHGL